MSKSQRRRDIKLYRRVSKNPAELAALFEKLSVSAFRASAGLRRIVEDVRSGIIGTGTSAASIIEEMQQRQMKKIRGNGNGILEE